MLDFTSALYLGLHHAHRVLSPWMELTTGRPAALRPAPQAERLSPALARLVGCERAIVAPSTLHVFWDLFDVLASERIAIYADAGLYPIARWGIERASAKGVQTTIFSKHDSASLERMLYRRRAKDLRPVVVADGICAETGQAAPLHDYLALVRERRGYLVIDDTQAFGLLGDCVGNDAPYGLGGGGTPAWLGISAPELIIGSSLAKAFGAPLAVVAGAAEVIAQLEKMSATREHCSPPSLAAIAAAQRAIALNGRRGDLLRARLAGLVRHFRQGVHRVGLTAEGGLFPVQTLRTIAGDPEALYRRLLQEKVRALLHRPGTASRPVLSFLITASHRQSDIARCMDALRRACALAS
jgi:8-amino-7-oxononanoate synthase